MDTRMQSARAACDGGSRARTSVVHYNTNLVAFCRRQSMAVEGQNGEEFALLK